MERLGGATRLRQGYVVACIEGKGRRGDRALGSERVSIKPRTRRCSMSEVSAFASATARQVMFDVRHKRKRT